MKINWCGDSCFEINCASKDRENISLVIDPKEDRKVNKIDIVLRTHSKQNGFKTGDQLVVSSCGEYERKGVFIQGITSFQDDGNIIYTIEAENVRICHLGYFKKNTLNEEQIKEIGNIDILMIPIDGNKTINYSEAVKIIPLVLPSIIIPMCYKKDSLEQFLKAMGEKDIEPRDKLNIQKKNIASSDDKAEIVILEEK